MQSGTADTNKTKPNEKLKHILLEHDTNPEVQEKIKVAFAEGYIANYPTAAPGLRNVLLKGISKFFMYVFLFGFALIVIDATNFGRSKYCIVSNKY